MSISLSSTFSWHSLAKQCAQMRRKTGSFNYLPQADVDPTDIFLVHGPTAVPVHPPPPPHDPP